MNMIKQKGLCIRRVIELAIAISIILDAIGSLAVKLEKANYIRRCDPNCKKKNDHSIE
jgi:hypothetical protein